LWSAAIFLPGNVFGRFGQEIALDKCIPSGTDHADPAS
jgi:hypothetical protein